MYDFLYSTIQVLEHEDVCGIEKFYLAVVVIFPRKIRDSVNKTMFVCLLYVCLYKVTHTQIITPRSLTGKILKYCKKIFLGEAAFSHEICNMLNMSTLLRWVS